MKRDLQLQDIAIDDLIECDSNPNVLDDGLQELLQLSIDRIGFVEPVLVAPIDGLPGKYAIVNGHHRVRSQRAASETHVPCLISDLDEQEQVAHRIAATRIHGQPDLAVVADQIRALHEGGWDPASLQATGFMLDEIGDLLKAAKGPPDDDTMAATITVTETDEPDRGSDKPFVIEVKFTNRDEFIVAKRALRKAAGKGGDMARGLLKLIGE